MILTNWNAGNFCIYIYSFFIVIIWEVRLVKVSLFLEEDIKVIESVDCDDFYKVFDVMRFKIAEFKGWTILGIPASLDDHRPGSKTVIFIEGKANETDFMEVIQEYSFLKNKVKKLAELYHDGEWLATGKLNQDPPTNKERFR